MDIEISNPTGLIKRKYSKSNVANQLPKNDASLITLKALGKILLMKMNIKMIKLIKYRLE